MTNELETPTPESSDETMPESWETTIEDTKTELAEMYLNFLDKQKWGLLATSAGLGVNLNPFQKDAIEYLTTEKTVKDEDMFDKIGKNIKKKLMEKISEWTLLEYDKASLAKMKALILQYKDNQTKLQELMVKIQEGIDPTVIEQTSPTIEHASTSTDTPTPDLTNTAAVVWTTAVAASNVAVEKYDKDKYELPIKDNDAEITSKFGKRTDPVTWEKGKQHDGIDISAPKKTPIHSVVSGKVLYNQRDSKGWGNYISIQWDDGKIYSYLHLHKRSSRKVGDVVQAGDIIGEVDYTRKSTWPHLHLAIKENNVAIDPLAALPEVFEEYKMVA